MDRYVSFIDNIAKYCVNLKHITSYTRWWTIERVDHLISKFKIVRSFKFAAVDGFDFDHFINKPFIRYFSS